MVAGDIGSGALGYTTIGEQVGLAQRMESAAPPGGVMLSESAARLVRHIAVLDEPELVHVKNVRESLPAQRLIGVLAEREPAARTPIGRAAMGDERYRRDVGAVDEGQRERHQCGRPGGNRQEPHGRRDRRTRQTPWHRRLLDLL